MKNRYFSLLAGMLFLLSGPIFSQEKQTEIIILHTNDMHSKIDNMAKLAYLADSLRKFHPFVFLVSAGDNFTGNPVVDMVPDKGYPMIDLMNQCGFVVSALGNHEFDMGQTRLKKRLQQANFPFICCNMDGAKAEVGQLQPYMILHAGDDITIAMLGIIQLDDNGLPSAHPSNMKEVKFVNGLSKAREFAWLKKQYGILIALTHLGIDDDIRLADSVPELDMIIGGHSHTLLNPPTMANNVMIVQAGSHLKHVGKTTLMVEDGKVENRKDEVISFLSLKSEDDSVKSLINKYNNNQEFNKIVGTLETALEGEDELGSLMTDAITNQLQVNFAFQNKGGIRLLSLSKGPVTLKDIYKLDPFNNQIVLFSMTTKEIESLICYGYKHEKGIDLQVSGMTYRISDDGMGKCVKVEMFDRSGKPLDPSVEYSVAMNDYMANTYIFDHKDPGTPTTLTTSETLVRYLNTQETVNYSGIKRVSVVK
ncbi:MAG: bifunctional UDP-sugar hydrolase/5'-nucleotidase [Bacteroidales bacterium]|nr:bifunctional UDP-sugar hydrolase/5'-nucleotidase [Bacteroidales bacterium]